MAKTPKNFIEPNTEAPASDTDPIFGVLAERTAADLNLPEGLPDGTGGSLETAVAELSLATRITAETNGALTWRILTQTYVAAAYAATTAEELVVALEDLSLVISVWFGDAQTRALEALDAETEGRE